MRRLFYKGALADTIEITGSDAHHLMHVMRAKAGDEVVVVDDSGAVARMAMVAFSETAVTLELRERLAADTESSLELVIAQCLLKADKMDFVVQKAVELGATGVMPIASTNCVVRYDAKKAAARRDRWQKIADEAAKQCGRTALLTVAPVTTMADFIAAQSCVSSADVNGPATSTATSEADAKTFSDRPALIFCYENETNESIKTVLQALKTRGTQKIIVVIGPEGGFTLAEAEALVGAGAHSVTLGRRILRAETAAVAALTVVQYESGDLN